MSLPYPARSGHEIFPGAIYFAFALVILIFGVPDPVYTQQDASTDRIMKYSRRQAEIFRQRKDEAEKKAREKGWVIKQDLTDGGQRELVGAGPAGNPIYYITDNVIAAITSGTNELWTDSASGLDLEGAGFIIGEWDGGRVRQLHQEFVNGSGSRVTLGDGLIALSDHSTHVAGTLIAEGQVPDAHGMAPAALLHSYDWNEDISEMAEEYTVNGLALSNHSYSFIHGWYEDSDHDWWWYGDVEISETEDYLFGFYDETTETWDSLAYLCPFYLVVKSAGNDRGTTHTGDHWVFYNGNWVPSNATRDPDGGADGYDCVGNIGVAKNILTVGAVSDIPGGYNAPADVVMTSFSAWGPTDDGRIKPDIVANGMYLYSSIATYNSAYDNMSGTSMASPAACGSLALLQDYYDSLNGTFMRASALKALVINTAFECGTNPGPEYSFGWGLLNSAGAADLVTRDYSDGDVINVNYLFNTETETYNYYSLGDTAANVTICWTDPPGTAASPSLNPTTSRLVHDLDLRIISEAGVTYFPWTLNPASPSLPAGTGDNFRDNVEKITIAVPTAGEYTIQVSHKGTISGQHYALVVSGLSSIHLTNTWAGTAGTGWNNAANWSLGHVPQSPEYVIIPAGCPNYPVLTGNLGVGYYNGYSNICQTLTIAAGATFTLSGKDLICAGQLTVSGILFIGDDATLNDGAVVSLASTGSIYTGYTDGYHGSLSLNSGSSVTQSGGHIYTEELLIDAGSQYNASAGYFHLYKQGTANSAQLIEINDVDNHFYYFYVDTLANAYLDNCTETLNVSYITRLKGNLSLNSFDMQSYFMNIYGELLITTGTLNITQTGPVFYNTSTLTMSGGELNTNNSIWFNSGSTVNVSGGTLSIKRDLYNQAGEFTPSGGTVRFFGPQQSEIKGATTFHHLEVAKNPGIIVLSASNVNVMDTVNIINGKLVVRNSTFHAGTGN